MKYLIVGLGNIGPDYHETRHNIGFMVVDALAKAAGVTFNDGRYGFTTTLSRERTPAFTAETFYIHEPQRKCRTILDAEREHSIGKRVSNSR